MARMTWLIFLANLAIFLTPGDLSFLHLWPTSGPEFRPWQIVTYAFVHQHWAHLVLNMIALISFGPVVERAWGWKGIGMMYWACAVFGALLQLPFMDRPMIGASAAIFGLVAAYAVIHPARRLMSLLVVPVAAWAVVMLYCAFSVVALMLGWMPQVAHLAHLGGALCGLAIAYTLKEESPR